MENFDIITYSAPDLSHTGIAAATIKSGGIAILDMEYVQEETILSTQNNLDKLLGSIARKARVGLRVPYYKLKDHKDMLLSLDIDQPILVLCGLPNGSQKDVKLPTWLAKANIEIWAEVTQSSQRGLVGNPAFSKIVVKGSESGGTIGEETTFVLAQQYIRAATKPIIIQGGIGLNTTAACIAAGATGIVLDDQLLCMPESPLPKAWKKIIATLSHENTTIISRDESQTRVVRHPYFQATKNIGWVSPEKGSWPVGQTIGFASAFFKEHKTIGRLIKAIRSTTLENLKSAQKHQPLTEGSPLANAHQTRFPIVQGPMTRVSDNPEFIASVAEAGGLPMLALSMMSGESVTTLLNDTKALLGDNPWGVGILGFVPEELRLFQLEQLKRTKPSFALIAGGTAEQVNELEQEGIETYLHAPTANLLRIFLNRGSKRFVFEGRECGGHVGPLGSFVLWEEVIETLLALPDQEKEGIHVLFAGGIHDDISAMMVSAMTGRLAAQGIKIGVLIGTAYLFTPEACISGAILPKFQESAIKCQQTSVIETGPGHAIRCIPTPFVDEFNALKALSKNEGKPAKEATETLEKLTLGRLRIASKGKLRDESGQLTDINEIDQYGKGMYMIGQVAGLQNELISMESLHEKVANGGNQRLLSLPLDQVEAKPTKSFQPVAIVGMSTILPQADDLEAFWTNLINNHKAITEIPEDRWDWELYYDKDLKARDKIVSKWGGFINDILFDPLKFGIPPHSLKSISPAQLLLLEAVDRALEDGGYNEGGFDRENTSVIVGSDGSSSLKCQYTARTMVPQYVDQLSKEDFDRLPEWNEESFAGILTNVLAGRVANRFDLGGSNFSVDAACASSLAAIDLAVKELQIGDSKMVIAAGIDIAQSPFSYTAFSKTQALSPSGESNPFDSKADGIVISEGVAVVLLKSLEDAERDGDKIYSVIKGSAGSSDGKGLGLTAPRSGGQEKAFKRVYDKAGFSPGTLGLYEAHATGTTVGDRVELKSLDNVLRNAQAETQSCAIGSVKALIGHTKTSAGIVGLIKSALSLYHQTLTPHTVKNGPLAALAAPDAPMHLLSKAKPWFKPANHPRRAGVSAFGFGGTNMHVVLEEYEHGVIKTSKGHQKWPFELFIFANGSEESLLKNLKEWLDTLGEYLEIPFRDLAAQAAIEAESSKENKVRLSIIATDQENLIKLIGRVIKRIEHQDEAILPPQISLNSDVLEIPEPMAFLFPGQGSQYLQMSRENMMYFPQMRDSLIQADKKLERTDSLASLIFTPTAFEDDSKKSQEQRLTATQNAQPAIGAISVGYLQLMQSLGIEPKAVAGHSYGEFTALHAAKMISYDDLLLISEKRGALMASGCEVKGTMAVVKATANEIDSFINSENVFIANLNAPNQTVISGEANAVKATIEKLKANGFKAQEIPVSGPFHTKFFKSAQAPFRSLIDTLNFKKGAIEVYSNTTGTGYPKSEGKIKELLGQHLLSPVRFSDQIREMHKDGIRTFVEIGPKQVLTGLVGRILDGLPHSAMAVENQGNGMKGLLSTIGAIYTAGHSVNTDVLFEDRIINPISLKAALKAKKEKKVSAAAVWLNGGGVRKQDEEKLMTGSLPAITLSERKTMDASKRTQGSQAPQSGDLSEQALLQGYEAYQKTMQMFLNNQENTMQMFLNGNSANSVQTSSPIVNDTPTVAKPAPDKPSLTAEATEIIPVTAAVKEKNSLSRQEATSKLMAIISERTGYPEDMLTNSIDLEAELGIDSIKRIEILDSILKAFPEDHEAQLQGEMQNMMRIKTIDEFLDIAFSDKVILQETSQEEVKEQNTIVENTSEETVVAPCPRFVMQPVYHELSGQADLNLKGVYLVTSDQGSIAQMVIEKIEGQGGNAILLEEDILASPDKLATRMAALLEKHVEIKGIVHCAPLSHMEMPKSLKEWRRITQIQSKSLFQLLKLAAKHINLDERLPVQQIVAGSMFGGYFGRGPKSISGIPAAGSHCGFLKALNKEWKGLHVRALDFDNQLLESEIVTRIIRELTHSGQEVEVGYPQGDRTIFQPVQTAFSNEEDENKNSLGEDAVVLATGGAKGITAEICKSLAVKSMTLILIGRSEQANLELKPDGVYNESFAELKEKGVSVEYRSVDVLNESDFKALIDDIYDTYGRLDAVIHGAGVIEDGNIETKALESFDKVFDTKVDTAFLLYKYLRPESLKLLVFFGSVSGRFGNQGQTDYAAANEVLNRFAWYLRNQWPNTRILTINWGPWSMLGMASPMVIRLLKSQGMEPIRPKEGCDFFLREIKLGQHESAEVIAGDGPWGKLPIPSDTEPNLGDVMSLSSGFFSEASFE